MKGNVCVYFLFLVLNFLMFFAGMSIFASSIYTQIAEINKQLEYLFVLIKNANVYDLSFLGLHPSSSNLNLKSSVAMLVLMLSLFSCYLRRSRGKLIIYLIIMCAILIGQIVLVIGYFVDKSKLVEWAMENTW